MSDKSLSKVQMLVLKNNGAAAPAVERVPIQLPVAKDGSRMRHPSPDVKMPALYQRVELLEIVKNHGFEVGPEKADPPASYVLSPRHLGLDGRGYLNLSLARTVFGQSNVAWFYPGEEPEEYYSVEVWLEGLTPGNSYIVQLRVAGHPTGTFHVSGSDTTGAQLVAGSVKTIPILLYQVDLSMSLVTVWASGMAGHAWGFFDATIMPI